ncbi:mechanosensitive ion channel family protein [Candidatus Methylomirabilis sp.]|uniref:mechanosensitive ion channel family protein n=1 Tax=Candidatus Methylomirabilis sp. TaxID=2032687 RepID=UPI002A6293AA|nr:mechanosensitive ion channel family protein [Candidatus Methylomirabilis sp.]
MNARAFEETFHWLRTGGVRLAIIVAGSLMLVRLLKLASDRVARAVAVEGADQVSEREKRALTLAGIVKTVGTTVIVIIATMMGLGEIGLDITPIIAGAGVVGLAVGFGAQSLIKDVIAGFFIILEGQFAVGDVIKTGEISGRVEQLNLRVTILRDFNSGAVHFIPNSELKIVSNLTKEWSRVALDIGVAYHEEIDRVIGVLQQIGQDLARDEQMGPLILEPPEVLGIESFGESQVTIKALVKTLPQRQWEVAREFRRRIKATFEKEGIEMPYPTRVHLTRIESLPPKEQL